MATLRPAARRGAPLPEGEEKRQAVRQMFDAIAPRYDLLNKVMTFGLDVAWRRRTVELLGLPAGAQVLDLACGTGDLARRLTALGRAAVGVDLSAGMLAHARPGPAPLLRADGAQLPFRDGSLDGAVSGFALRNFSDLPAVFSELGRVLKGGGRLALLEVATPESPLLARCHRLWLNGVVPRLGRLTTDPGAYSYLPRSVAYLPRPDELSSLLGAAGFADLERHLLTGGVVQVLTGTRR